VISAATPGGDGLDFRVKLMDVAFTGAAASRR
jgi:hypothetical protein